MTAADHRPRVLVATTRCTPEIGGIETHVVEVTRRLRADGWDVEVLTTDRGGELPRAEERDGLRLRRVRAYPRSRDWYLAPGLLRAVLRSRADLVHVQGVHTLVPPLVMLAALLRRTPYVVTFHTGGSSSPLRSRSRGLQWRLLAPLLRRAAALVAVSEHEARTFEQVLGQPAGTIPVVRNGGTLPAPSPGVVVDPDLVVSPGRLERYKGHHRAIAALPHLLASRPGARLRILGSGPAEFELGALAAQLGVADRVEIAFVPPPDRQAMADELAAAGTVCLLSDYEAHPVAVMEALAAGRPAVVLRTSGMTELADAGLVAGVDAADGDDPAVVAAALDAAMPGGSRDGRCATSSTTGGTGSATSSTTGGTGSATSSTTGATLVEEGRQARLETTLPTWETCTAAVAATYRAVLAR